MATYTFKRGGPTLFNAKSLEELCGKIVYKSRRLESKLHQCYPHNLNYEYYFEGFIKNLYTIVKSRHIRDAQSFERWFRKMATEKIDLLSGNKKDLEALILISKSLESKILKFKAMYGIVYEVYKENAHLLSTLESMRWNLERVC